MNINAAQTDQKIIDILQNIESQNDCKILFAIESGSRAWGFASPDSDFDVRFIYVRPVNFYLSLLPKKDVIELPINDELDINGWDIQKMLKLLHNSNVNIFEWFKSPIVYRTSPFAERLNAVIPKYFSQHASICHYLNLAEKNFNKFLQTDNVRVKKYFYVLRAILSCLWIIENDSPPPIRFQDLAQSTLPGALQDIVQNLLHIKISTPEVQLIPRVSILNSYFLKNIEYIKSASEKIPNCEKKDWNELNQIFLDAIHIQ